MIVVDASALVAIILEEPERVAFYERLLDDVSVISPVGYWEAAVRVSALLGQEGRRRLDRLMNELDIEIASATDATARTAVEASLDFGKRAPAKVNLGDCFAYALARERDAPLLFKGDDFTRTDVRSALAE